jgi:hypothetical protein
MSSPEYLTCRQRREAAYKTRTKCIVTSERWSETEEPSERGAKRRSRRRRKTGGAPLDASREDQVKLASFASGVEVALVVSASIDWGKRCPHFLAREGVRRARKEREKTKRATSFRARRRVSRRDERSRRRLLRRRRRSNRPFRGGRTSRGGERRSGGAPAPFASDADGTRATSAAARVREGDSRRDSISCLTGGGGWAIERRRE